MNALPDVKRELHRIKRNANTGQELQMIGLDINFIGFSFLKINGRAGSGSTMRFSESREPGKTPKKEREDTEYGP